jgi:TP901-1 family phage major tail protein
MRGVDILIKVEDPVTAGTYVTVGGQRNATLSESSETIDNTSKDSGGAYEYDYGLYGWTVSADGLYITDDAGYQELRNAMRNKNKVKIQISEKGTATKEGEALVISSELEGPYDGEVTYSVEFQGSGNLADLPAGV